MSQVVALLGYPVHHSMSPAMHNDQFQRLNIAAQYEAKAVEPEQLAEVVTQLRKDGALGFNVTIPHKEAIIPLLDRIDPLAQAIGAVNTVVREGAELVGYNTDGLGFYRSLMEAAELDKTKPVLLIGAGGAARAIYYTLVAEGFTHIDIANRNVKRAQQLLIADSSLTSHALALSEVNVEPYHCIIQTTAVGMYPNVAETPLSLACLRAGTVVADIVYNPLETTFLREAKERGATVVNGVGMFVYQGLLAFEKWLKCTPDATMMKQLVLAKLGGN